MEGSGRSLTPLISDCRSLPEFALFYVSQRLGVGETGIQKLSRKRGDSRLRAIRESTGATLARAATRSREKALDGMRRN